MPHLFSLVLLIEGCLRITARLSHNQECILKVTFHMTSSLAAQHFRNNVSLRWYNWTQNIAPRQMSRELTSRSHKHHFVEI